jgi:phosphinothricin acetyltransferase
MSPGSGCVVRDASTADAAEIARIYNHYIRETTITFEVDEVSPADIATRIDTVQATRSPWLVALLDGHLVGYAYAGPFSGRCAYAHTTEVSIYLDAAASGRGIGTALYRALFDRIREGDVHAAIGVIALPNPASVALHEKFGMRKVGHMPEVGRKFGSWIDVGYWQVNLDDRSVSP